jgi:glutathione S-transferase
MTQKTYRLYGGEVSYFTGKVRAYLRWKNIPFTEIVSDAKAYKEVILPRVGFPVIPVVVGPDDETLQDSTDIIDELERRHGGPSIYPSTLKQKLTALLLEVYGDEWLVIPAMHYRWHYNRDWAMQEFGKLSAPHLSPEEQAQIGTKLAAPFANAAELLGGTPDMHRAIETSYEGLLAELDAHFAVHPYLLGTRPSIGDFGLFGPLYAHQYRDPWTGEHMRQHAPHLVQWLERMVRMPEPLAGDFLPHDEVPDTVLPILRRMMREQLPVLADSARLLSEWLAAHPGEKVPRVLGKHDFTLEGQTGQRIIRPYSLWMLQRARECYRQLDGAGRNAADRLLQQIGGERFQQFEDPPRLLRNGMSVKPADG